MSALLFTDLRSEISKKIKNGFENTKYKRIKFWKFHEYKTVKKKRSVLKKLELNSLSSNGLDTILHSSVVTKLFPNQ